MKASSNIKRQRHIPFQKGVLCWTALLVLMAGISFCGCSLFKPESKKESEPSALEKAIASSKKDLDPIKSNSKKDKDVRFDGGLLLGNTDNVAYRPGDLAKSLSQLMEEDKWTSARSLIGRYPDIVTKIMLNEGVSGISQSDLISIAGLFDEKWSGNGNETWKKFVKSIGRDESVTEFIESRSRFLELIGNNEPNEALSIKLVDNLGERSSSLAIAEAARLEGIAHLMQEDYSECIAMFKRSVQLLSSGHPYLASKNGLLLGEAQRHAKAHDDWKSTWQSAVTIQSRWLNERGLMDPEFWTKAAFLRPVETPWPPNTLALLERTLGEENLHFEDKIKDNEAVIWAVIGVQSLKRHESQNAILAFKKSEALISSRSLKEELQMQQALAMIDGGQPGPASAILLRLSSSDRLIGDRSKAILATLKLQNGSLAQGMNLLQSAIKSCNQWPVSERLRAQADYGLSYLMTGREEQGIALLNHVHDEFIKINDVEQANQCLWNIATYYEKTDQGSNFRAAISRLKKMEAQ